MYESHFGVSERPFVAAVDVERYFPSAAAQRARSEIARSIERDEGTALLVGAPGTGKSLLGRLLAADFSGRLPGVILDSGPLRTQKALLQAILYGLGLAYRGLDEGEARLALIDHLSRTDAEPVLLVVDDAQWLPHRLLGELRMIANLARQGRPRVRLVLAGSLQLDERFAVPRLDSFNQRIRVRAYLEPFTLDETLAYIRFQFSRAGGDADGVFTAAALEQIHRATDGVPRLINQLGDHALLLAFAGGIERIEEEGVAQAWSDLQQLPAPWNTQRRVMTEPPADEGDGGWPIVEFGTLDDEPCAVEPAPAPRVAAAREGFSPDDFDDDFHPAGAWPTEIDLPLADDAAADARCPLDDEVIVDRYARLDSQFVRPRRVAGDPISSPTSESAPRSGAQFTCHGAANDLDSQASSPQRAAPLRAAGGTTAVEGLFGASERGAVGLEPQHPARSESDASDETAYDAAGWLARHPSGPHDVRHDFRRLFARLRDR